MIHLDLQQGSDEWYQARCAIPTGSGFSKIITSAGKASTQADAYMNEIIAQILIGKPVQVFQKTEWMERGNELEQEAADMYEFMNDEQVEKCGFFLHDDKIAGASPDRLVGDKGLLEIKCPAPHTHVKYLLRQSVDSSYIPQVQGQMWVAEREWCDWFSYYPDMQPVQVRVERDDAYIAAMEKAVSEFHEKLQAKLEKLKALGVYEANNQ